MNYKGQHIDNTKNVIRYEKVEEFSLDYSHELELGPDDLDKLKELIRKKEAELNEKGIKHGDVKIELTGCDEQYINMNGKYKSAEFITELCWEEMESVAERNRRIEWEKDRIDMIIESRIASEAMAERIRRETLAAAVRTIEENGGTVTNLEI